MCLGSFSFSTDAAPALTCWPAAICKQYPLLVGYWYPPANGRPSFTAPTPIAYLSDLYRR